LNIDAIFFHAKNKRKKQADGSCQTMSQPMFNRIAEIDKSMYPEVL